MKLSTALFASVVAICCLSCSIDTNDKFNGTKKAAEQGNADAQYNLGTMYYRSNDVPQDYTEAVKWYRKSAEQGHAGAQTALGAMIYLGIGIPEDTEANREVEAIKWYRKAAEQGHAEAQFNLGAMYLLEDEAESIRWYRKAAEQGHAGAQTYLKMKRN